MPAIHFISPIPKSAPAKPMKLRLGAESFDTPTWAKVLEMAARAMLSNVQTREFALAASRRFSWMAHSCQGMERPCELEPGTWIELNQGSHGILVRTKMLLDACGYPLDLASLECREVEETGLKQCIAAPALPYMSRFLDDIREHWPEGFDFSDGAVRLLEGRCGSLPPGMERQLKAAMFRLRGGIWIVPDSVAPKEAIDTVLREADRSISDAGFVSIIFLAKANDLERSRLSTENDRCAFVEHVLSSNGFSIAEHNGVKFATAGDSFSDGDFGNWCALVRKAVEASGALPFAQLMQDPAFGNIDEDAAFALLREYEPTVIPEHDPDGGLQFKMLSEYYLPEDMETALREIVVAADNGGAITAAALCSALSQRYDCDFAQDYALDPAYSLKWVVDAVWRVNAKDEPRYWDGVGARARFVSVGYGNTESGRQEAGGPRPQGDRPADLPSQVEAAFTGVFSNEDFWHYSTETYGLASSREAKIAQLGYLAPRFIRLDRDRWMSVADFRNAASWNETKANAMAEVLRNALGSASMLPMATLGSATLDALPAIPYRWTPELAASVAALLCPGCHVANHGTSPFAVTALLVPRPIAPDEVIRYTVGIYAARNPHARSVEGAFEFLKANNIRFRLTRNCREEIETCLAKETL